MMKYPKNLLKTLSNKNNLEMEKVEPPLVLPFQNQEKIHDLVAAEDNKMTSNVNRCFVAKKKVIESMLDDGYDVIVPKKYKWHASHKQDQEFISKMNIANYNLMHQSLAQLTTPRGHVPKKRKPQVQRILGTLTNKPLSPNIDLASDDEISSQESS